MPTFITSIFSFLKPSSGSAGAIGAGIAAVSAFYGWSYYQGGVAADAKYVVATQEAQSQVEKATTTAQLSNKDIQNEYDNQITAIDAYGDGVYASDTNPASVCKGATAPARNRKSVAGKPQRIPAYDKKVALIEALGKFYNVAEFETDGK